MAWFAQPGIPQARGLLCCGTPRRPEARSPRACLAGPRARPYLLNRERGGMSKYGQVCEDWRFSRLRPYLRACGMSKYGSANGWRWVRGGVEECILCPRCRSRRFGGKGGCVGRAVGPSTPFVARRRWLGARSIWVPRTPAGGPCVAPRRPAAGRLGSGWMSGWTDARRSSIHPLIVSDQVPICHEARYLRWMGVRVSMAMPMLWSLRRAISRSISLGTP